jgi:hypothetical protein
VSSCARCPLETERWQETERYLAAQDLANNEELAGKYVVRSVMMMKQEALNVVFGSDVLMHLICCKRIYNF